MKTLIAAGIAVVALVAAIATNASGQTGPQTRQFIQTEQQFGFVDAPPKGGLSKPPSVGDVYVIGGKLTENGNAAGSTDIVCTVTRPGKKGASQCSGTVVLTDGAITLSGVSHTATNSDSYAVTGGTGDYTGATGVITTKQGKGETEDITVKLG